MVHFDDMSKESIEKAYKARFGNDLNETTPVLKLEKGKTECEQDCLRFDGFLQMFYGPDVLDVDNVNEGEGTVTFAMIDKAEIPPQFKLKIKETETDVYIKLEKVEE